MSPTPDPTALAEALLPCPLCGTSNVKITATGWAECQACSCSAMADEWNLRTHAETVAQDARRKAFEEAAQLVEDRADWHDMQESMADAMDCPPGVIKYHENLRKELHPLADAVRALAAALQTGRRGRERETWARLCSVWQV